MAGRQQPDARAALAQRAEKSSSGVDQKGLEGRLNNLASSFQLAMPRGLEAKQLIRDALTCVRTTRDLDKCDENSIIGSLMTCAQLGLRPGVLGHAWLLPFWDTRAGHHRAQLVIGYQGYVELGYRSGSLASLVARTVYEGDTFDVDYGIADNLVHKPARGVRGKPVAYYAIAKFTTGGHAFWTMTHAEVEAYRDRYATAKTKAGKIVGPWVTDFEAMARKTQVRQLAKWIPKSTAFAQAIAADEMVRLDYRPEIDPAEAALPPGVIDGELADEQPPTPDSPPQEREDVVVTGPQEPENAVPAPTQRQMARMHALFAECEIDDSDRHAYVSDTIGRTVTSAKDLTRAEAGKVIDRLEAWKKQSEPPEAAPEPPADEDGA